jgi:hypothetical protein
MAGRININRVLDTPFGSIAISILLGLGLAALFRSACKDGKCIVVTSPATEETANFVYKVQDECFKYTPVAAPC